MKDNPMEAVVNVRNALEELKTFWECQPTEGLQLYDCDNCKYYNICGSYFDIRRALDIMYTEFAKIEGKL